MNRREEEEEEEEEEDDFPVVRTSFRPPGEDDFPVVRTSFRPPGEDDFPVVRTSFRLPGEDFRTVQNPFGPPPPNVPTGFGPPPPPNVPTGFGPPPPPPNVLNASIEEAYDVHNKAKEVEAQMMVEASKLLNIDDIPCPFESHNIGQYIADSLLALIYRLPDPPTPRHPRGSKELTVEEQHAWDLIEQKQKFIQSFERIQYSLRTVDWYPPRHQICFIYYILNFLLSHPIPSDLLASYLINVLPDSGCAYSDQRRSCTRGTYERCYLAFIYFLKMSPHPLEPRLQEVLNILDKTPTDDNLLGRLRECMVNFGKRIRNISDFEEEYEVTLLDLKEKEANAWVKNCLTLAFPKHITAVEQFLARPEIQQTIKDYVEDAVEKARQKETGNLKKKEGGTRRANRMHRTRHGKRRSQSKTKTKAACHKKSIKRKTSKKRHPRR
jgi:hypothetical protein